MGKEPKERKTDDPAHKYYSSFSFFPEKWQNLRDLCRNNKTKTNFVVSSILKAINENPFQNFYNEINDLWETFLDREDAPYSPYVVLEEDVPEILATFPISRELHLSCLKPAISFDSLDKLVENIPKFFNDQAELVEDIQTQFISIKQDLIKLIDKNLSEEEIDDEITKNNLNQLLNKAPNKLSKEYSVEIYKGLTDHLNLFKINLVKLIVPVYFFLEERFFKLSEQGYDLKYHKEVDTSPLDFEILSNIFFTSSDNMKDITAKLEFIEEILIRALKKLLIYYCYLFNGRIINQELLIKIKKGIMAIDALNTVFSGLGWDLSSGILKNIAVEKILEYSTILEKVPEIMKIAEQLGRFEGSWATKEEWTLSPFVPHEIYNVKRSNDISRALVIELGKLGHPILKSLFMARYIDHSLLTYDLRGKEKSTYKEKEEKKRGPIVACIDTSGSMSGYPEELAKALSLAVIKIAQHEKRDVHIILFSGPSQFKEMSFKQDVFQEHKYDGKMDYETFLTKQTEWRNQKRTYYSQVIDLLSFSFGGGTDFRTPLKEARKMLKIPQFKKADILFVSDGIAFVDSIVREITEEIKSSNARIFTVVVGTETSVVREFSDYLYILSPRIITNKPRLDTKIGKILKQITLPGSNKISQSQIDDTDDDDLLLFD
ncbi:MAG: hypothetical protein ACTSQ8_01095 [Candidatus Helarchaeota archaeon]